MNQLNQLIKQIESSVVHVQESQYEFILTTNSIRTDLDYRQYRLTELMVTLIQELVEIKHH